MNNNKKKKAVNNYNNDSDLDDDEGVDRKMPTELLSGRATATAMPAQRAKRSCAVSATSTSTRPSGATSMTNYEESDDDDDVVVTKKKSRATTASKTQWRKEDDDNASYNDDDEDLSSESVNDVIYLLDDISESLDVLDLFGDEEDSSDDEEKFDDNDDEVIVPLSSKCDFFLQLLSLYSDCI